MATKRKEYLLKTRPPLSIILLGLIVIFLSLESFYNPVWIIYSILLYIIYYVHFSRYCCVVIVTKEDFTVVILSNKKVKENKSKNNNFIVKNK